MSSLRNIFISSVLLFSLVGVACSNKNATTECDQTKFDCTPKTETPASDVVSASEAATTALQAASDAVVVSDGETITTATTSNNNVEISTAPDDGVADFMKSKAAKTLAATLAKRVPAVFEKEIDPDFDWKLLGYTVAENNIHTGATTLLVEMSYHERQEPLSCSVDVVWFGDSKYDLGLTNPDMCKNLYNWHQENSN